MSEDSSDPFALGDLAPSKSDTAGNSFELPEASGPPRSGLDWRIIAGAAVAVVLIGAAGVFLFRSLQTDSPENTVRAFYAAVETRDPLQIRPFFDPDDSIVDVVLPNLDTLLNQAEQVLSKQLGQTVKLNWQFQKLDFNKLEQTSDTAKVQVSGTVRISEVTTNLGVTLPYQFTHDLVKKNLHWYLKQVGLPH